MRSDAQRRLKYSANIVPMLLLLLVSLISQVNFSFAQIQTAEGQFPLNIIVSSSADTTPNSLKLLATQIEGSGVQEVGDFSLDTADNITAQPDSELLVFVSDSSVGVVGAKAGTASGEIIDLVPSPSQQATNSFSLANLPAGVYLLDVLAQKGNTRGVYEGILEIGQQPTTTAATSPLSPEPTTLPSPTPAASPVASPSDEQLDNVENGDEDSRDEDNGGDNSGDEDSEDTEDQDEDSGDTDEGEEKDTDEGGGDEGGGDSSG